MIELGTFIMSYPCWALLHKDCVIRDAKGRPVNVTRPVQIFVMDDSSGGAMVPLFTDEDLAERFMGASGGMEDFVAYPLSSDRIVLDALRSVRGNADAVTLDKPKFGGKPYAIWPIDYAIQRIEAGEPL